MIISQGTGKRFFQMQIYFGIYSRKGLKDNLVCGFGNNPELSFHSIGTDKKLKSHVRIVGKK
jgi:hypothetical protein